MNGFVSPCVRFLYESKQKSASKFALFRMKESFSTLLRYLSPSAIQRKALVKSKFCVASMKPSPPCPILR